MLSIPSANLTTQYPHKCPCAQLPLTPWYLPFSVLAPVFVEHKESGCCTCTQTIKALIISRWALNSPAKALSILETTTLTAEWRARVRAAAPEPWRFSCGAPIPSHNGQGQQISSPPSAKKSECSMSFRTWGHIYGRPVGQSGPDLGHPDFPRGMLGSLIQG